jgi:hypothetical protein
MALSPRPDILPQRLQTTHQLCSPSREGERAAGVAEAVGDAMQGACRPSGSTQAKPERGSKGGKGGGEGSQKSRQRQGAFEG